MARSLREHAIAYLVLDLNPANVRAAEAHGHPAYFGDVTSAQVLEFVDTPHARALVVLINDAGAAERAVAAARGVAPDLHIVVRARYLGDLPGLREAGANEIVVAEMEAAAEVVVRSLAREGIGPEDIRRHLDRVRARETEK